MKDGGGAYIIGPINWIQFYYNTQIMSYVRLKLNAR